MIVALMELSYFDDKKKEYRCNGCPVGVQKLRRCRESRMDFNDKDNVSVFPMRLGKNGTLFGFCPAKATWYSDVVSLYRALTLSAETGQLLFPGSILEQPDWAVEFLGWFIPKYKALKHSAAWGGSDDGKQNSDHNASMTSRGSNGNHERRAFSQNRGRRQRRY